MLIWYDPRSSCLGQLASRNSPQSLVGLWPVCPHRVFCSVLLRRTIHSMDSADSSRDANARRCSGFRMYSSRIRRTLSSSPRSRAFFRRVYRLQSGSDSSDGPPTRWTIAARRLVPEAALAADSFPKDNCPLNLSGCLHLTTLVFQMRYSLSSTHFFLF